METAGEVLCGKVPLRETGDMGPSVSGGALVVVVVMVGGEMGACVAIVAARFVCSRCDERGGGSVCKYRATWQEEAQLSPWHKAGTVRLKKQVPRPNKAPVGA